MTSCHDDNDDMSLEDLQPSVKTEVDQVKDNSLEKTTVGHNGPILTTGSQEIGSQKTEVLTVMETDTVLMIYNLKGNPVK